jgi:ubiquinone/menaquinone biosynthesis C-methylase UbiE
MSQKPWYEQFFGEAYLQAYGPVLAQVDVAQEVEFLVRELGLEPGMRLLDLCCGQGRHAVPLARRGLRVVGQDLSPYLLQEAEKAASAAGVKLELVHGDMRDIPWCAEFDAAINMFTAFGYFEEDRENFRVLEGVARALKPGGRFCIDVISHNWLMRHWESTGWSQGDGGLLKLETRRMDWMRGVAEAEHTFIDGGGRRWTITSRLRLFTPHELVEWLRRAGLRTRALFGDSHGSPYGLESQRLVAVAQKE